MMQCWSKDDLNYLEWLGLNQKNLIAQAIEQSDLLLFQDSMHPNRLKKIDKYSVSWCTIERRENMRLIRKIRPLFLETTLAIASCSLAKASLKLFICSHRASF